MGYRVGFQCFDSSETAHDYVLSQVQPLILPDGSFVRPEKTGKHWVLQGKQVDLSFPECSQLEQFKVGASIGSAVLFVFVVMFLFKSLKNMLYGVGRYDD